MTGIVLMFIFLALVIAGGVFIFAPDFINARKKKQEEKNKPKKKSVEAVFNSHYSKTDEMLEADKLARRSIGTFEDIRRTIQSRNILALKFLQDPVHNAYRCPMCAQQVSYSPIFYASDMKVMKINCGCPAHGFREKLSKAAEELGYDIG